MRFYDLGWAFQFGKKINTKQIYKMTLVRGYSGSSGGETGRIFLDQPHKWLAVMLLCSWEGLCGCVVSQVTTYHG
uniref:Uncharacterized protein n=1 Tax=Anguilla anguilla TaxID=7936 RepID=A0A0E9UZX2_ANGAN